MDSIHAHCTKNGRVPSTKPTLKLEKFLFEGRNGCQKTTDLGSTASPLRILSLLSFIVGLQARSLTRNIEISSLNGTFGFPIFENKNTFSHDIFVSLVGDLNGDGIHDAVIGGLAAPSNESFSKRTYVLFGKKGLGAEGAVNLFNLSSSEGFTITGDRRGNNLGESVAGGSDVNGDSIDDLIISDFGEWTRSLYPPHNLSHIGGKIYVLFGSPSLGLVSSIDISTLNGTNGFTLEGPSSGLYDGLTVATGGDLNADGIDDIAIGTFSVPSSPKGAVNRTHQTFVVFGKKDLGINGTISLDSFSPSDGMIFSGEETRGHSSSGIACNGDLNGDGIHDLAIGAFYWPDNGDAPKGKTYVVFGNANLDSRNSFNLTRLNGTQGFCVFGAQPGDFSGQALATDGDLDGDGIQDLVISAPGATINKLSPETGMVFVVYGDKKIGDQGAIYLSSLNETSGFNITGEDSSSQFGRAVCSGGDLNNDGFDDLVVSAPWATPSPQIPAAGKIYVYFGGNRSRFRGATDLGVEDGIVLYGGDPYVSLGISLSSNGDLNGDGIADLLVGAGSALPKAYVLFGRSTFQPVSTTHSRNTISPLPSESTSLGLSTLPSTTTDFSKTLSLSSSSVSSSVPHSIVHQTTNPFSKKSEELDSTSAIFAYVGAGIGLLCAGAAAIATTVKCMNRNRKVISRTFFADETENLIQ